MTYAEDVRRWVLRTTAKTQDVVVASALKVHESIVAGSALTGAPGQPVDTGYLRASWVVGIGADPGFTLSGEGPGRDPQWPSNKTEAPPQTGTAPQVVDLKAGRASIVTNAKYAEFIEEGVTPLRSPSGGVGSVKLTRAAWPRIVDAAVQEQS
jgi:hypothetical protein